jgi:hypothetical protein
MAHYAILDHDNKVTGVFVGKDEDETLPEGYTSWEEYYGGKRTSYNTFAGVHQLGGTPFRKNMAAIGYSYDVIRDAFIPPQPFASWTLNEETCQWDAPIAIPEHTVEEKCEWLEADQEWKVSSFN